MNPTTHAPQEMPVPTATLPTPKTDLHQVSHELVEITQTGKKDLLMIQARCNVAGHDLSEEFVRLSALISQYETFLKSLMPTLPIAAEAN